VGSNPTTRIIMLKNTGFGLGDELSRFVSIFVFLKSSFAADKLKPALMSTQVPFSVLAFLLI
jgi:hypothetical protein